MFFPDHNADVILLPVVGLPDFERQVWLIQTAFSMREMMGNARTCTRFGF